MSRREAASELSVQALLESAKEVKVQPESVRARMLARARATVTSPPPVVSVPAPRPRLPTPVMAAAAMAAFGGIVGTVLAFGGGWSRHQPTSAAPSAAVRSQLGSPVALPSAAAPPAAPAGVAAERLPPVLDSFQPVTRAAPGKVRREDVQASYAAELELMRSAHTAYAAHDYTSALVLVGDHARRFPGGLLGEEREALRVRCLLGAGRTSQARAAAESFAARYPRSVLLGRLRAEVGAGTE